MRSIGILMFACTLVADAPKVYQARSSNKVMEMRATLVQDREAMEQRLEGKLPPGLVIVEVLAQTLEDKPIEINLDDFQMVSARDGQKSTPYSAEQLAGGSAMVILNTTGRNRAPVAATRDPVRLPGGAGVGMGQRQGIGNAGTAPSGTVEGEMRKTAGDSKLVETLKKEILPTRVDVNGVKGLLFFPIEGKYKPKDITILYRGREGRITMDFGESRPK